jgi:hypothetical protein
VASVVKDVLMQAHFDVRGASGATYRFRRVGDRDDRPATAGNFLYVRGAATKAVIVYAGECDSLIASLECWETARLLHGADGLFVRLNVAVAVREAEQADIVAAYHPAMNRP